VKDPYATLGVTRDSDENTIRSRYRELARRYHPDVNPGDSAAEERFKAVSEAYAVLSDSKKKAAFDDFGEASLQGGFDADSARRAREAYGGFGGFGGGGFPGSGGGLEDLLSNMFGGAGGGRRRPRPGRDLEADLSLDFLDAAKGCEQSLTINRPGADGGVRTETISVRIPPGVADRSRLRLRGKGGEGSGGGRAGDLYARIRIRPHPVFRREDRDIFANLPVSIREAVLGAKVDVATLDGSVTLTIPAGTDSGTKLRLRGKGIPSARSGEPGDFYAVIQIRVPNRVSPATAEALEGLDDLEPENLRDELSS